MSRIKNSDCPTCHEWIGQCACEAYDAYPSEATDNAFNGMLEECYQHFASLPDHSPTLG